MKPETHEPLAVGSAGIRCDFCNELVPSVRRVALDRGYERLQTPHKEQFACPRCSDAKERARRGLSR
jgi:phage FluMu protein Com